MIEKSANTVGPNETPTSSESLCHAPVTIFAIPKAFIGDASRIQRNAFASWKQLSPAIDILLFGNEAGIAEYATENGIAHVAHVERNSNGTPLVHGAFAAAHRVSTSPVLVYCNSDIILDAKFADAMERLLNQRQHEKWLAIGQRTDVDIDRELDFGDDLQMQWLQSQYKSSGVKASHVCKEFFAFTRNLLEDIPPFAIGRGNWDNWIVASTKRKGIPVVDLSGCVRIIHQAHDYNHTNGSRLSCYVNGDEARENERLAGGRNLISGARCTHRLHNDEIRPIGALSATVDFLADVPRFAKLMTQLFLGR